MVENFSKRMELAIMNTFFQNRLIIENGRAENLVVEAEKGRVSCGLSRRGETGTWRARAASRRLDLHSQGDLRPGQYYLLEGKGKK